MRTFAAGLVVLGLTALAVPPANAQETATTGAPSIAIVVGYIDFGITNDPNDDCAYIKMSNPAASSISNGDIRIVRSNIPGSICSEATHNPGTVVDSTDPAEIGTPARIMPMTVKYEDQDGNGNFDANDTLYLDTASSGGLSATNTGANVYAFRLSRGGGQPPGSFVFASHSDYYGGGPGAKALTTASVTWLERNGNTAFDTSDYGFLLPQNAAGFAASSTIPLGAMRLTANNPNGAFGTNVKSLGNAGALPAPALTITTSPVLGASEYEMKVTVTDFTLDAVTATPANIAAHGHIHYFLNGVKCEDACAAGQSYATSSTSFTFHGLVAGDKVSAELVNNDHSSLDPVIKQEKAVPTLASTTSSTSDATNPTTSGTTSRNTSRVRSTDTPIPALGLGPVLLGALVAAIFLTRRRL